MTEVINGVTKTHSYTYDEDNRLVSENTDDTYVYYTYDSFGRLSEKTIRFSASVDSSNNIVHYDTYSYKEGSGENSSSLQVSDSNDKHYTYDGNGNILTVGSSTQNVSYEYDSANQLIRENNWDGNFTKVWTYDNAGNIQSRTEYTYTTQEDLSTLTRI